jgi:hypothetical protein
MGEGPTDSPGERGARRRRVRVRLKDPGREATGKRLRKVYSRHKVWLVPLVMLVAGTLTIWLAFKVYIGD